MGLASFTVAAKPGELRVEINDDDVTDRVAGFELHGSPDELTTLVLHHRAGTGAIQGQGVVQVVDHDVSPVDLIRQFLDAVDTAALEQRMLETSDWGSSIGDSCIAVLKELLA